jgi:hypothetical protein
MKELMNDDERPNRRANRRATGGNALPARRVATERRIVWDGDDASGSYTHVV